MVSALDVPQIGQVSTDSSTSEVITCPQFRTVDGKLAFAGSAVSVALPSILKR